MAVARRGEKVEIHLHETTHLRRKKKSSIIPENLSPFINEFTYLSFSLDDNWLISLSTDVEPVILIWNLETSHLNIIGHYKISKQIPCFEVMFCPTNPNIMSICGKETFKLFKYSDDEIKLSMNHVLYKEKK